MGKSTVIQSLLLLKQSIRQGYIPNNILLNGEFVNIGVGEDLLNGMTSDEHICIALVENDKVHNANMNYSGKNDVMKLSDYDNRITEMLNVPFEYLNAERSSPQSIYPKSSYNIESDSQLGIHGQYAVHYMAKHQDDTVSFCSQKEKSDTTLKFEVQKWLNEISPNVKFEAKELDKTDLAQLGYYYNDKLKSNTYRPTNVGFGISYVLPVIIALVKAKPNSIVIIENPEAHLHPQGQRKIGELLCKCAAKNVQVFVETHSDHILNGIRIAVKQGVISPDMANLLFFNKRSSGDSIIHDVENPQINQNGKLDYWPEGFFDEWDKALDQLIGG